MSTTSNQLPPEAEAEYQGDVDFTDHPDHHADDEVPDLEFDDDGDPDVEEDPSVDEALAEAGLEDRR